MNDGVELTKTELKPGPFCGMRGKVKPRGRFMTAAFRHADWCFFNHGLPSRPMVLHESEFEEWNKRTFVFIANDDGTIEILGHRFAPLRTCRNVDEYAEAGFFTCGVCGFGNNSIELTPNYCPACGAKVVSK